MTIDKTALIIAMLVAGGCDYREPVGSQQLTTDAGAAGDATVDALPAGVLFDGNIKSELVIHGDEAFFIVGDDEAGPRTLMKIDATLTVTPVAVLPDIVFFDAFAIDGDRVYFTVQLRPETILADADSGVVAFDMQTHTRTLLTSGWTMSLGHLVASDGHVYFETIEYT